MFFHISFRSYIFHISFHRLSCIIQMMGSHHILWLACKICWHSNKQTKKMGKIRWKYNSRIVCKNIELQTRNWFKEIPITWIQTNTTKIFFTNPSKTIYLWMICDTPIFFHFLHVIELFYYQNYVYISLGIVKRFFYSFKLNLFVRIWFMRDGTAYAYLVKNVNKEWKKWMTNDQREKNSTGLTIVC